MERMVIIGCRISGAIMSYTLQLNCGDTREIDELTDIGVGHVHFCPLCRVNKLITAIIDKTVRKSTDDPVITAILDLVDNRCNIAIAEATGFYNSRTAEQLKQEVNAKFITEMNKATQDAGP